ncbi:cell surface protein (plasmid) [Borrelia turcica IST7]|uniref:Cell surface protein n=1 Tax=Borrelia turcica IST7 TaxID=1104446 RepID=A0A386PNG5_9SPIR|nr:Vsp/OspC family lipoprotein [Borrelia turcica]AYE37014.1 cell surface protein [Borrelia turcica IST7]
MKKNTLSAILMTLFLFIACNNSGSEDSQNSEGSQTGGASGQTKKQEKAIDLAAVSKKIEEISAFMASVKKVDGLVGSIGELAKAIGQKITGNGIGADVGKNSSLLAGVHQVVLDVGARVLELEKVGSKFGEAIKGKIATVKEKNVAFLNKLRGENVALGVAAGAALDDDAKKAILVSHNDKTKGADELEKLNNAVEDLVKSTEEVLGASIKELTSPSKVK